MNILSKLPGGLILRSADAADADRLVEFNIRIHSDDPDNREETLGAWTRDLFERPHPTFHPGLATIVEDPASGEIVSTALIFPQTWTYSGMPLGVGRPELIGTDPAFRGRGLIRAQMDVLHRWSADLGHRMQAITGIPWFYRQFGYEMCIELGGGRSGYEATLPKPIDTEEPYCFRPASSEDVPFFLEHYAGATAGERFACLRSAEEWAYELGGKSPGNHTRLDIRIIELPDGRPVGYSVHHPRLDSGKTELYFAGLIPGESWQVAAPCLLRFLRKIGQEMAAQEKTDWQGVYLSLGSTHPIFDLCAKHLPVVRSPYAWYLRIPDLPAFIRQVAPALEQRLEGSILNGYTGQLRMNFYRSGLVMRFEEGRIAAAEPWTPTPSEAGDVRFPDLSFISLLSGRRTFKELSGFFADCYTSKDEHAFLLETLFPAQASNVWGIE